MVVALIFVMDLFTVVSTFIVGWGYSRTGSDGITKMFGKVRDHLPWDIERTIVAFVAITSFVYGLHSKGDTRETISFFLSLLSWALQFPLLQQLTHNITLEKFGVEGYWTNINESPNGTSHLQSMPWVKITELAMGIAIPITYYLIY